MNSLLLGILSFPFSCSFSSWPFPPSHHCSSSPSSWHGWASSREDAEALFYRQADWGYLKEKKEELTTFCTSGSSSVSRSTLECSSSLTFCRVRNLLLDFRGLVGRVKSENLRYSTDLFSQGQVQVAHCGLNTEDFNGQLDLLSCLQSWAPELRNIKEQEELECDLTVTAPTLIVKLDATSNMYHHFCDFFNLYLSLQLNQSLSSDTSERQVLILDNHPYSSSFQPAWNAFTSRKLWNLASVVGRRVCFTDAVLPLLPRMMFGLYYNTPLVPGCGASSMVAAFSQFMLDKLGIDQLGPKPAPLLRLTLLSRDTKYRRIINQQELVRALEATGLYEVQIAQFTPSVPFLSQLSLIHNTDLLLGLHGAGLTHLLFLPDWAQVIELYNCEDPECYMDLARLRGVGYSTWQDEELVTRVEGDSRDPHTMGPAHKKFSNYHLHPEETLRIVDQARLKVLKHQKYIDQLKNNRDEL